MRINSYSIGSVAQVVGLVTCWLFSSTLVAKGEQQVLPRLPMLSKQEKIPMPEGNDLLDAPSGLEKRPRPPFFDRSRDDASLPSPQEMRGPSDEGNKVKRPPFGSMRPTEKAPSREPRQQSKIHHEGDIFQVVPQKCIPAPAGVKFAWNFENEKLINILRQVSDLLCITIVVNDAIGESLTLTIIGKSELTPNDAFNILLITLKAKSYTLIKQGKTWVVTKLVDAKSYPTPIFTNKSLAGTNEETGTFFYKVQHAPQEVLKNIAKSLISKDAMAESYGDQYILVIDSNSNIRRLQDIFAQVDIEDAINKIHVITLAHSDAKTVEKQLRDLFDVASASGGPPRMRKRRTSPEGRATLDIDKIIADERTNSLIIVADKDSVEKLKEVVALIDQPASDQGSKGKIHVQKLRHSDAKKLAETLSTVVSPSKNSRFGRRRPDESSHDLFEGEVKITAHEATNTLVTVCSANDYRSLLATINKLDVRREQVYIEAVIMDVEVNNENEFGINLFAGIDPSIPGLAGKGLGVVGNPGGRKMISGLKDSIAAGATGANISGLGSQGIGALAVLGNFLSGGVAALVGPAIGDTKVPSFGAVLRAFSSSGSVDVLSTPYALAIDNQETVMSVGEKIPVLRGTSNIGGGLGGGLGGVPFQNIANEDVKLTFKITPHVGADDNIRLDIDLEVNEPGTEVEILNQKHSKIRTKSVKTTLVLKDQQTGVIGGLIHHKNNTLDSKVPFLGDIPLLGWLFKSREGKKNARSLLMALTVYSIRSEEDYSKILERKLKEREEFAKMYYGGKIKEFNKYIDYDKKAGPMSSLLIQVDNEMNKVENGGSEDDMAALGPSNPPKEILVNQDTLIAPIEPKISDISIQDTNNNLSGRSQMSSLGESVNHFNDFDIESSIKDEEQNQMAEEAITR
jgi:general secretion pathway protein D